MELNTVQHDPPRRSRLRRALATAALAGLLVVATGGAAVCALTPSPPPAAQTPLRTDPTRQELGGVAVTGLHLGTIQIRRCHELPCLPPQLPLPVRLLRILADDTRTTPLPIVAGAIEVDGRVVVVDTGELASFEAMRGKDAVCDPVGEAVDHAIGVLDISPERELRPQLRRRGLWPVDAVALTHLHFDHTGGVPSLVEENAQVPVHTAGLDHGLGPRGGFVLCKSLKSARLTFFEEQRRDHGDAIDATFGKSVDLAPRVRLIALPGHTPLSLGVLVDGDDLDVLFIGDIAFRQQDLDDDRMNGIHHDASAVADSMRRVRTWAAAHPTVVVPAHDPDALDRLAARAVYTPRGALESP